MADDQETRATSGRGRFRGNLKNNEVEMDLDKFVDLINSNYQLQTQIDDLKRQQETNPWRKIVYLARAVDAWRIFPRIFITVYMILLYYSVMWFMAHPDPSAPQSALISTIVGAGAGWFGLYVKSGGKDGKGEE